MTSGPSCRAPGPALPRARCATQAFKHKVVDFASAMKGTMADGLQHTLMQYVTRMVSTQLLAQMSAAETLVRSMRDGPQRAANMRKVETLAKVEGLHQALALVVAMRVATARDARLPPWRRRSSGARWQCRRSAGKGRARRSCAR